MKWHNEKRKIKDLIPFENNPRNLSKKEVIDLNRSLKKFDLVEIPVININNKILAGHQRIKLLEQQKGNNTEIDVRVPDRELTLNEEKEYLIRSNKNTGSFDFDLLEEFFEVEELIDWGFNNELFYDKPKKKPEDLKIIGFKKNHILISFHPDKYIEIKSIIQELKKVKGIEIENAAN